MTAFNLDSLNLNDLLSSQEMSSIEAGASVYELPSAASDMAIHTLERRIGTPGRVDIPGYAIEWIDVA